MIQIDYNLLTNSRIYIGAKKPYGGNFMESFDYIPGGVIRGAVARLLLEECPKDDDQKKDHQSCPDKNGCRFYELFGCGDSQDVIFTDCYPESYVKKKVWVLPITARTCKYHPGFKSDERRFNEKRKTGDREIENHGVLDILISQLVYEELNPSLLVWKLRCNLPKKDQGQCNARIDSFGGFYQYHGEKDYEAIKPVSKVRLVRAAINRRRNTAEDEMLYSLELIEKGQNFYGSIILPGEKFDLVKNALHEVSKFGWIGGASSRGFGRIEINAIKEIEFPELRPIQERIERFNEIIEEERKTYQKFAPTDEPKPGKYFTIDLQSDAIFVDRFGQRVTILSPGMLLEYLDLTGKIPELTMERSYTSPVYISGWSTAWRMPKEVHLGVKAGSLFVYLVKELTDELIEALERAEEIGMGEKREEGFGRFIVCHPFHLEVMPV